MIFEIYCKPTIYLVLFSEVLNGSWSFECWYQKDKTVLCLLNFSRNPVWKSWWKRIFTEGLVRDFSIIKDNFFFSANSISRKLCFQVILVKMLTSILYSHTTSLFYLSFWPENLRKNVACKILIFYISSTS